MMIMFKWNIPLLSKIVSNATMDDCNFLLRYTNNNKSDHSFVSFPVYCNGMEMTVCCRKTDIMRWISSDINMFSWGEADDDEKELAVLHALRPLALLLESKFHLSTGKPVTVHSRLLSRWQIIMTKDNDSLPLFILTAPDRLLSDISEVFTSASDVICHPELCLGWLSNTEPFSTGDILPVQGVPGENTLSHFWLTYGNSLLGKIKFSSENEVEINEMMPSEPLHDNLLPRIEVGNISVPINQLLAKDTIPLSGPPSIHPMVRIIDDKTSVRYGQISRFNNGWGVRIL